jgi:ubiquinone/menaquinone biosynthesis C-methylase UbiE
MQGQKQLAIDQHSRHANLFADRYRASESYGSCFHYSRKRLDAWLDRYIPSRGQGLRLLDVGCGTGSHIARYRSRGFDAAGVDGSEKMLEHARAANPSATLELADVEHLPFKDASFDFVLCIEVLRYLPDSAPCVREMARVLKPGGTCLATAAPILNLNGYYPINRLTSLIAVGDLTRLKQFFTSSGRLSRQFTTVGFRQPRVHGVYLGPVNWVERLAPSVLPRALRSWELVDATVANLPFLREFSNMFLVHTVRGN